MTASKILLPVLLGLALVFGGGCHKESFPPLPTMVPGSAAFAPGGPGGNLHESDFEGGAAPYSGVTDAYGNPILGASGLTPIYFEYDSYQLSDQATRDLGGTAQALKVGANTRILVRGNCDERGATEYNLALGEKRANVARDYLISLGVDSKRIAVLSLGEEQPVCRESHEDCWSRNRRDDFGAQ